MTAALERLTLPVGDLLFDALACGPADGELVLLLHGWPEFADSWTPTLHALGAAGYRAVAVDQRGFAAGARPLGPENYAVELLVADALAFADAQGGGRFHLVGHDWGGIVAWVLAGAHAERLRSLSVLATPHPTALRRAAASDPDQYHKLDYVRLFRTPGQAAEKLLLDNDAAALRDAYGGRVPASLVDDNVRRLSAPGALTATLNWYRGAIDDDLDIPAGRIGVDTLYVWGDEDIALGRVAAESTGEFVDAAYRFEVLAGVSHWLPEEVPDTVNRLLLAHLRAH